MAFNREQESARAQFDRQSRHYGKTHILADVSDVNRLLARCGLNPGGKALDVATGGGHAGLRLAELGWEVTCSDLSQQMLDRVKEVAESRKLSIQTRLYPAEDLQEPSQSMDLVVCRAAAHHFSHPEQFVNEVSRILKPGGVLLLVDGTVPDGEPEWEEWVHQVDQLRDPTHVRFLKPSSWKSLCDQAGLELFYTEFFPLKQPDIEWYFETASTPLENRKAVLQKVASASAHIRERMQIGNEAGRIVWSWTMIGLLARKPDR